MKLQEKNPRFRVTRAMLACQGRVIHLLPNPTDETLAECGQFLPDTLRELVDEVVKSVLSDPEAFRKDLEGEGSQ